MTLKEAKGLRLGQPLRHTVNKNADGTPQRWRVNGKVRTQKKNPGWVKVPIKRGLRDYGYITEDNLNLLVLG